MSGPEAIGGILEDDQPLYDWGIENRYEQYYPENGDGQPPPANAAQAAGLQTAYSDNRPCYGDRQVRPEGYILPSHVVSAGGRVGVVDYHGSAIILPSQQTNLDGDSGDKLKPRFHPTPILPNGPTAAGQPQSANHGSGRRPLIPHYDLDANEVMKIERKRARNRVAATKCRMRKLERIAVLDHQASQLRADNEDLRNTTEKLRAEVYALKQEIKWHVNNGCKAWRNSYEASMTSDHPSPPSTMTQLEDKNSVTGNGMRHMVTPSIDASKLPPVKCEVASPDSTTNHVLYNDAFPVSTPTATPLRPACVTRVKRELEDDQKFFRLPANNLQNGL